MPLVYADNYDVNCSAPGYQIVDKDNTHACNNNWQKCATFFSTYPHNYRCHANDLGVFCNEAFVWKNDQEEHDYNVITHEELKLFISYKYHVDDMGGSNLCNMNWQQCSRFFDGQYDFDICKIQIWGVFCNRSFRYYNGRFH